MMSKTYRGMYQKTTNGLVHINACILLCIIICMLKSYPLASIITISGYLIPTLAGINLIKYVHMIQSMKFNPMCLYNLYTSTYF